MKKSTLKGLLIAIAVIAGIALGIAGLNLLEHLSEKAPEGAGTSSIPTETATPEPVSVGGKEYVFPSRHLEVSDRGEYYYADFNLDGELWNSLFSECSDFSYDYEGIARECRRDKLYDETCSDCYSPYFFLYVEFSEENFTDLYAE